MSAARRAWIPAAAGVAVAVVVFAVVLLATGGGGGASGASSAAGNASGSGSTRAAAALAASSPHAAAAGRVVFAEMGCGGCHRLAAAGSNGPIGPSLDDALPRHTRASLLAKIRDPGAGSIMPGDFARRMTPAQLGALVDFLLAARSGGEG
jgi:mono/diheme cytochrome c family protein